VTKARPCGDVPSTRRSRRLLGKRAQRVCTTTRRDRRPGDRRRRRWSTRSRRCGSTES
jgi:hypothetical protein